VTETYQGADWYLARRYDNKGVFLKSFD